MTEPSSVLKDAAHNLLLDVEARRLFALFHQAEIQAILLKGPAIQRWLYPTDGRAYGDIDILVGPKSLEAVGRVLKAAGYARRVDLPPAQLDVTDRPAYAFSWRSDRFLVEVHQTLVGLNSAPSHVWQTLTQDLTFLEVAGSSLPVLGEDARALHLASHAAQHGAGVEKSLEDLRRGLALVELQTWERAHSLAAKLDGQDAFAAGLSLLPEGRKVLESLGGRSGTSLDVALHAAHARSSARSLEWFNRLPSREKTRWVVRKVAPPVNFMRHWHPLARTGLAGLALAYLWRPLWLAKELVLGAVERRRVRRSLKDGV